MRSPIFALEEAIAGCAFKIAPEREQELAKLRDLHQIVLQPVDERGFGIRVNPASGVVTLPVASLEYLWACTYQYLIVYQEMVDAQRAGLARLDLAGSPRLRTAEALYSWARNNLYEDGKRS
jgi:Peptidase U49